MGCDCMGTDSETYLFTGHTIRQENKTNQKKHRKWQNLCIKNWPLKISLCSAVFLFLLFSRFCPNNHIDLKKEGCI